MISYDEALSLILSESEGILPGTEEINLQDALDRIIAEDVISDINMPPFDNSAMDGYAIRFTENERRKIAGEISAGNFSNISVDETNAVLITTGSKIPKGADTVAAVEDVTVSGNEIIISAESKIRKGSNIRPLGSDLKLGETCVYNYTKITPAVIAVLAGCGRANVKVYKRLSAAILATGDELIPVTEKPGGDKIRATNVFALSSAISASGHIPVDCGFVKDNRNLIKDKINGLLDSDADMLITTGGVSVGKYDFMKELFEESGVKRVFWRANIKPGKPFYFGRHRKGNKTKLIFGLPGNPVSTLVNFHVYIEPALNAIFRQKESLRIPASLTGRIKKSDGKRHFCRGVLSNGTNGPEVFPLSSQSSGNYYELGNANCLIIVTENILNPKEGEILECMLI